MREHATICTDLEVRALLAGATTLQRPVTLRNSRQGAYPRSCFKLNHEDTQADGFPSLGWGYLKGPVHDHPPHGPGGMEGIRDRLYARWMPRGLLDRRTGKRSYAGDLLWVKEAHVVQEKQHYEADDGRDCADLTEEVLYRASPRVGLRRWTQREVYTTWPDQEHPHHIRYLDESTDLKHGPAHYVKRWRPAARMPKWAARIWLRVLAVHPVRVGRRWHWCVELEVASTTGRPS